MIQTKYGYLIENQGYKIEFASTGSTAPPDAPKGCIAGAAMTNWYRINNGDWKIRGWGFGCFDAEKMEIADEITFKKLLTKLTARYNGS